MQTLQIGQWQGFFTYGDAYGQLMSGQEVEFRMFIEHIENGQFSGRVIDWEGVGAVGEESVISGFIADHLISFKKVYPRLHVMDEFGNLSTFEDLPGYTVEYEGYYDESQQSYSGTWEIIITIDETADSMLEEVSSGTWRMKLQA